MCICLNICTVKLLKLQTKVNPGARSQFDCNYNHLDVVLEVFFMPMLMKMQKVVLVQKL